MQWICSQSNPGERIALSGKGIRSLDDGDATALSLSTLQLRDQFAEDASAGLASTTSQLVKDFVDGVEEVIRYRKGRSNLTTSNQDTNLDHLPNTPVRVLLLSHNSLREIRHIIRFQHLVTLSLQRNRIQHLRQCASLHFLPHLKHLSLEYNPVTHIPFYRPHLIDLCCGRLELLDSVKVEGALELEQSREWLKLEEELVQSCIHPMMNQLIPLESTLKRFALHRELRQYFARREWPFHDGPTPSLPQETEKDANDPRNKALHSLVLRTFAARVPFAHVLDWIRLELRRSAGDEFLSKMAESSRRLLAQMVRNRKNEDQVRLRAEMELQWRTAFDHLRRALGDDTTFLGDEETGHVQIAYSLDGPPLAVASSEPFAVPANLRNSPKDEEPRSTRKNWSLRDLLTAGYSPNGKRTSLLTPEAVSGAGNQRSSVGARPRPAEESGDTTLQSQLERLQIELQLAKQSELALQSINLQLKERLEEYRIANEVLHQSQIQALQRSGIASMDHSLPLGTPAAGKISRRSLSSPDDRSVIKTFDLDKDSFLMNELEALRRQYEAVSQEKHALSQQLEVTSRDLAQELSRSARKAEALRSLERSNKKLLRTAGEKENVVALKAGEAQALQRALDGLLREKEEKENRRAVEYEVYQGFRRRHQLSIAWKQWRDKYHRNKRLQLIASRWKSLRTQEVVCRCLDGWTGLLHISRISKRAALQNAWRCWKHRLALTLADRQSRLTLLRRAFKFWKGSLRLAINSMDHHGAADEVADSHRTNSILVAAFRRFRSAYKTRVLDTRCSSYLKERLSLSHNNCASAIIHASSNSQSLSFCWRHVFSRQLHLALGAFAASPEARKRDAAQPSASTIPFPVPPLISRVTKQSNAASFLHRPEHSRANSTTENSEASSSADLVEAAVAKNFVVGLLFRRWRNRRSLALAVRSFQLRRVFLSWKERSRLFQLERRLKKSIELRTLGLCLSKWFDKLQEKRSSTAGFPLVVAAGEDSIRTTEATGHHDAMLLKFTNHLAIVNERTLLLRWFSWWRWSLTEKHHQGASMHSVVGVKRLSQDLDRGGSEPTGILSGRDTTRHTDRQEVALQTEPDANPISVATVSTETSHRLIALHFHQRLMEFLMSRQVRHRLRCYFRIWETVRNAKHLARMQRAVEIEKRDLLASNAQAIAEAASYLQELTAAYATMQELREELVQLKDRQETDAIECSQLQLTVATLRAMLLEQAERIPIPSAGVQSTEILTSTGKEETPNVEEPVISPPPVASTQLERLADPKFTEPQLSALPTVPQPHSAEGDGELDFQLMLQQLRSMTWAIASHQ